MPRPRARPALGLGAEQILWIVVFSIVGWVMLSWIVAVWSLWRTVKTFPRRADEVTHLVEAVYRYRNDRGLWPQYLDDLVPEYADDTGPTEWRYFWSKYAADSAPTLHLDGPYHMSLTYHFPFVALAGKTEGWECSFEGDRLPVAVVQTIPEPPRMPRGERITRILAELERRVQREPDVQVHQEAMERYSQEKARAESTFRPAQPALRLPLPRD